MVSLVSLVGTISFALPKCKGTNSKLWTNCSGTQFVGTTSKYVGDFKDGRWHGYGIFTLKSGDTNSGVYVNGIFSKGTVCSKIIKDCYEWDYTKIIENSILESSFKNLSEKKRKLIQTNLNSLGLYKSTIDGLFGKKTATGLKDYNKQKMNDDDLTKTLNVNKLLASVLAFKSKVASKPTVVEIPKVVEVPKTITKTEAELFKQIKEDFDLSYYGGFIHSDRLPNTLFFFSKIEKNDSFEFRKALRVHDIELVVLSSPGGSVFEGLQTAGIIHDKNLKTYIPKKSLYGSGNCSSACSFMFFAGATRSAEGNLGVHQFYSGKASDEEKIGATQKLAQFTVSEIIGFLNEFETPPWVFERMFQQKEMYYFKESELLQLETEVSEETKAQHEKAERFISDFRSAFVKIKD